MEVNKIYHGDCFEILKQFDRSDNVKLVITDPPYMHDKNHGGTEGIKYSSKISSSPLFNESSFMMKEMSDFKEEDVYRLLDEYKRIMNKMNCFIFSNDSLVPFYTMWAYKNKKKFNILTWEKPLSILNRNRFSMNLEYCIRIYDNVTPLNPLDLDTYPEKKVYYSKNRKLNSPTNKIHPTQKPIDYLLGLIELCSNEGDLVLDTFFGSGQTGKACQMLNRNFIGIEKEEKYVKIATNYLSQGIEQKIQF
jgi:DNA modification methylase